MFHNLSQFIVSFLPVQGNFGQMLEYWIYNNLKILFILFFVVFFVAYLRTYFPAERIKDYLKGKNLAFGYFFAIILGIISPFCTCSTIPIFLGMVSAGIPFGIIITFLFVSPMINFAAIVILFGSLGIKITLSYLFGGIIIAVLGSFILVKMKMEKFLVDFSVTERIRNNSNDQKITFKERLSASFEGGLKIISQTFPYIIFGVTVGALIHGFVPEEIIINYLSGVFSVPGAVIIGIPVYMSIMGIIPIAESLVSKGLPIGTAVAFMMSVAALSLPQFILLKKAMRKKLFFYYGLILSLGIVVLGIFLNLFFN
jgi:uncharacterized protein